MRPTLYRLSQPSAVMNIEPQLTNTLSAVRISQASVAEWLRRQTQVLVLVWGREFEPHRMYFLFFVLVNLSNVSNDVLDRHFSSGRIAQSVERWSNKPLVMGSSPIVTTFCYSSIRGRAVKALRSGRSQLCWRGFESHRMYLFFFVWSKRTKKNPKKKVFHAGLEPATFGS